MSPTLPRLSLRRLLFLPSAIRPQTPTTVFGKFPTPVIRAPATREVTKHSVDVLWNALCIPVTNVLVQTFSVIALARVMKAQQSLCKSIRNIKPFALFTLSSSSESPCFTSYLQRAICSGVQGSIILTSYQVNVSNALYSIFTKKEFNPDDSEVKSLGPKLSNEIVESVLVGLKNWRRALMFFDWASNQHGYKHNMYTYNAMASVLSQARQNDQLRALAMDILNSHCPISPGALGYLIRCLGRVGLVDQANELFDQVKLMGLCMPNSYSYNCLLEAASKSGMVDLVEVRLKEMLDSGCGLDKHTLTPVLQLYCNAGMFDNALKIFNMIHQRGWADEHIHSILVVSFSKWGKVDKAFELIDRMEKLNMGLNEKTYYILIHGFVKETKIDKALHLFDKMKKSGFSPTISLFDVLIGGLCKNNENEKALSLLSEMKELGIRPDAGIFTKLISSFKEERDFKQLLEEYQEDMDFETQMRLYNSFLKGLFTSGLIDKAYQFFRASLVAGCTGNNMADKCLGGEKEMITPDTTSFSIVINGLLQAGKLDLALTLFRDMPQFGCKTTLLLYNNLIEGLCKLNRLEETYELFREMEEVGLEPTQFTFNCLFGCLCRRGDVEGALEVIRKMHLYGHEPYIIHATFLVKELCKHNRVLDACNFLAGMVEEGVLPDIISYTAAMNGLININEVDQAFKLFKNICGRGYCPDLIAHNTLIKALCKAKRIAEAEDLLNEMILKGLVPSVVTYNSMIDGWCKNDEIDRAMLCLSSVFVKEREPNVITYSTLIDGLCTARRPDDALKLWNEMALKGIAPNKIAFASLINGLCKCGRSCEALHFFHEMKEKGMEPECFLYVALISGLLSDSKLPSAFGLLKEMAEVQKLPNQQDKNYSVIRDAICKFSEDARISPSLKSLMAEGCIPTISPDGTQGGSLSKIFS